MKRRRIIKATAWIHVGIVMLSLYTIARIPEHVGFAAAAFTFSMIWLTAYVWTNCDRTEFYKSEISLKGITARVQKLTTRTKKN